MNLRALLRKRFRVQVSITEQPTLHDVAAAGESDGQVGHWFSANFGVGNAISVATLAITLIGVYVTMQSSIVDLKAKDEAEQREMARQAESIVRLNQRLTDGFVSRQAYTEDNLKLSQQLGSIQAGQLQIYGALLAGKGK